MTSVAGAGPSWAGPVDTLLIDADVHEPMPQGHSGRDLIPYLDPHWQRYLSGNGGMWLGLPNPMSYTSPMVANALRAEWSDAAEGGVEALRRYVLEEEQVSIAILNGPVFYPSSMRTDPEFAHALAAAYNDYQVEHWLDHEPRLRGSVHVAAQRPDLAAREIDRVAAHPQIVQVVLPLATHVQWGDPAYQPIWEAAVRNDLAVAFHHDAATNTLLGWPRYVIEWHTVAAPHAATNQLMSLICQGVFDRNPQLKVIMLEGGIVWIQWLMWRLDQQYREMHANIPWVKRLPSEHIRDNVRAATQPATEVTPREFAQLVEMTGTEGVYLFATDYPHYDADSAAVVLPGSLPDELRRRVRYENALATYPRLAGLLG
ncbi:MAG TPA: amidohydrolase family protein [Baekduia sp.]